MNLNTVKIAKIGRNTDVERIRLTSEEQIRAAFRQREEAVIGLFKETPGKLTEHINRLEDQIAKNFCTSYSSSSA